MNASSDSPSPRVARKRARARVRILDATREVVRRHGLEGLTIEAVAEAADVSKPAVYYYFDSKDELARALLVDGSLREVAAVRAAVEAVPPGASVLDALVRAYVAHHAGSLLLFQAEYVWAQVIGIDPEEADRSINAAMVGLFDLLEARLRDDAERGLLHGGIDLRRAGIAAWMAAHGLVATLSLLASSQGRFLHRVDDMVDELCGILTRGVYAGT